MANTFGIRRSDRAYLLTGRNAVFSGGGSDPALLIPIQDGSDQQYPPKYVDVDGVANNVFDVSEYNGIYFPTINAQADVCKTWFTAANLNAWFVTRGAVGHGDIGFDDLSEIANGLIMSDGNRVFGYTGAKGGSLALSCRQNDVVRCQMGFMAPTGTEITWENVATVLDQRASFANVVFVSGVDGVTDFTFSIENALQPNPIFAHASQGSGLVEVNAGKPRISLSLTIDAAGTFPTNFGQIVFTIKPPGATTAVTFTLLKCRVNNPDDIGKRGVRASQTFNITCKSVDGVAYPITIS